MKSKVNRIQKNKVLEACRGAAAVLNTTSFQILSDTSVVCQNDLDSVTEFLAAMKPFFDKDAWDHTIIYSIIRRYLPSKERTGSLCSYDFYRALNKAHYFSAESAIKRIREFGRLKALPYHRSRSNIRGVYKPCSSSVQWFVNEINSNWRQFLAIGSRLGTGEERSLFWKNYYVYPDSPIKATSVDYTQFDIHIQGRFPEQTLRQVEMFLAYVDKNVFAKVVRPSQYCYRITVERNIPELEPEPVASQEVKAISGYQSDLFKTSIPADLFKLEPLEGDPNLVMLKTKIPQSDTILVEDHYANEIEKSINEMTLIIDDYDKQIDELTAKRDKIGAQRGKLLRAYKALTE